MYNVYIKNIKGRGMSRKAAIYYLANLYTGACYERQRIESSISYEPELTDIELSELEEDLEFFKNRIFEVKRTAKHLGVYSDAVFEYGDFSEIHWKEDDYRPLL